MDERDAHQVAEKLWKALQTGDWETAGSLLHDDFVQEWPQSGERIVGRDNAIAINQNFPGGLPCSFEKVAKRPLRSAQSPLLSSSRVYSFELTPSTWRLDCKARRAYTR